MSTNFSIDFGTVASTAPKADDAPLFAAVNGRVAGLGTDEAVFHDPATDRSHVMTTQVLHALNLCREFLPMDRHVQNVCTQLPGMQGQQAAVRRVLDSLATRGLLVSDDAWLQRLQQAPASAPGPLSGLFVRACDRPNQLKALLASVLAQPALAPALQRLVVVDDSRSAAAVSAHAALLADFAARWPLPVHHLTPALWRELVAEAQQALPAAAASLAALLLHAPAFRGKPGGGQGRNLITLLAAGSRYLLLDDDNQFPLRRHPEFRDRLAIGEAAWAIRTFADHAAAMAAGEEDAAALETEIALCGAHLGELLQRGLLKLDRAALHGLAPSRDLILRGDARVALTVNGHRGGSCSAGFNWMLLLDPPARAGLAPDDQAYLARRADPSVWFGCNTFSPARHAQFTPFAIDNTRLMPCTSPFGRNEDSVYNALVALGDSRAVQLHVPWAVGHLPEAGRDRTALVDQVESPGVNIVLTELIGHVGADLYASEPAQRFAFAAARMDELSQGSDATLISYLREFLVYRRSTLVSGLQRAGHPEVPMPSAMRSDLKTQINVNGQAIIERGALRLGGMPEGATPAEQVAQFRHETGVLAQGLRDWPAIWDLALTRREAWLERARVGA
jgi:hypothetical protein